MRFSLLLLLLFLFDKSSFAQFKSKRAIPVKKEQLKKDIHKDMKELEASRRAFDSSQKIYYDSLEEIMMQKDMEQKNNNLDAFMSEKKEKETDEVKSLWVRAGLLAIVLTGIIIIRIKRKKKVQPGD